jgi:hypothetical protein
MITTLVAGDTTSEVAGHFRLSAAQVSGKELHLDSDKFQAVPVVA